MAQNFPNSPSTGTSYTVNSESWTYDGSGWIRSNLATAIPGQTGNSGKYLTTNGTTISWTTLTGTQGTTGSQGIQGVGNVGTQGATGSQGIIGSQGVQGVGNVGTQGATGSQGTTGSQGLTGSQGTTGSQGLTGSQGITGSQGLTGTQGTSGTQGTTGPSSVTAIVNQQNTSSGALGFPVGTTAERPVAAYNGYARINTDIVSIEIYYNGNWLTAASLKTIPNAPTITTATVIDFISASVQFVAPAWNGGSTITSYTAVSSPGGVSATLNQANSGTITVSGLIPNNNYTFTVYATNAIGNSANSTASNTVSTPATPLGRNFILSDMDLALTNLVMLNSTLTTNNGIPKAKSYALSSIYGSD